MSDQHFGGCACGAVRYRVQGEPVVTSVCHCKFCQKRLASAFAILAVFPEDSVEVTQGDVAECKYRSDKTERSEMVSHGLSIYLSPASISASETPSSC